MLTKTTSNRKIKYCTADIEAHDLVNFISIGFFDGENLKYCYSMDDFFDIFLTRDFEHWMCFAHNGSGYDFNFFLDALIKLPQYKYKIIPNNGIGMLIISKGDHIWYLADSLKIFSMSLEEATNSFDVAHKKMANIDRSKIQELSQYDCMVYNEYDCKGLYEVLKKFESWFAPYGVSIKPTIASQAMAIYRKNMPFSIPVLKPEVEDFIRKAYYGGRVEIFKMRVDKKFYMYDVKSLYPYCMKKYSMPIGTPVKTEKFIPDRIGFYLASIEMPDQYLPSLPMRKAHKLLFPVGKWKSVYSSNEIELARQIGATVRIKNGYVFSREFIFDKYVDDFFALKESLDGTTKTISKIMLNSLYGKFGQSRVKQQIIKPNNISDVVGCTPFNEHMNLWSKDTSSKATFIIPSIACWVTSCARIELFKWLVKAGEDHIYYCDTDSVCSTKKLNTGSSIGNLKLEGEFDQGIFIAPKMYALKNQDKLVTKVKGFEKDFRKTLTFENFEDALRGDTKAFRQNMMKFAKFKESLRRNNSFISMVSRKKSIQSTYDKRTILPNFDTKPLVISQ